MIPLQIGALIFAAVAEIATNPFAKMRANEVAPQAECHLRVCFLSNKNKTNSIVIHFNGAHNDTNCVRNTVTCGVIFHSMIIERETGSGIGTSPVCNLAI